MSASEQNNNMKRKCSTGACSIPPRTRPISITTAARSIPSASGSVPLEVSPNTDFSIQVGSPPPSSSSPMSVPQSSLPQQFRQWQYRRRRTTSETSDDFKIDGAACTIASTPVQNEAAFPWMSNWSSTTPPDDSRPCVTQQPQGIGDFDGLNRMRTGGVSDGIDDRKQKLPTVFKWEGGGKQVCISGSFNQWKTKITMAKSQGDFYTIIDLPEGLHEYKFYVDGQWMCDNSEKKKTNDQGTENNVVNVKSSDFEVFEALDVDSVSTGHHEGMSGSPTGDYGQEIPHRTSGPSWHHGGPPILPPHLLQVILNKEIPLHCEPTLLPEPNHVMLNHLYALSIKDGVMVLSATHRYRKKYVTTLLYKPI